MSNRKIYCIRREHLLGLVISILLILLVQWFLMGNVGGCTCCLRDWGWKLFQPHIAVASWLWTWVYRWCLAQVQLFCDHEGKSKGTTQTLTQSPTIFQLPSSGLIIWPKKFFVIYWWQKWPQFSPLSASPPFTIWLCSCSHQEVELFLRSLQSELATWLALVTGGGGSVIVPVPSLGPKKTLTPSLTLGSLTVPCEQPRDGLKQKRFNPGVLGRASGMEEPIQDGQIHPADSQLSIDAWVRPTKLRSAESTSQPKTHTHNNKWLLF